jgi:hypothetical protein
MKKAAFKRILWILGGGLAGFAWYYFVGCAIGACPISSNPYISTAYGAFMGVLASGSSSAKGKKEADQ